MSSATLFAWQVFFPLRQDEPLRRELHRAIAAAPARSTPAEKQAYHRNIVQLVLPQASSFVVGNWDYTDEDPEARSEFDRWCRGTVVDARERTAPRAAPGETRYFFLTLLLLLTRGKPDDLLLEKKTTLPPEQLWQRSTFTDLLETVGSLDFDSVRADAVYLCPGADDNGLTEAELAHSRYSYLRRVV